MGGMKVKRLKGGGKALKWKKGQSCLSNPSTSKFRNQANKGFFETIKDSELTKDAVAQHQSVLQALPSAAPSMAPSGATSVCASSFSIPQSLTSAKISIGFNPPVQAAAPKTVIDLQQEMEEMSVNEEDDLMSQAKTFASRFTTCTIPAFEDYFNKFSIESEHQVLMLSFHATVQETIRQRNLPETSTSYFVAIIMSMEAIMDDTEQVSAGLSLLVRVIKSVPPTVLKAKCGTFGAILNTIISKYTDTDNVRLLTHALGCLSILLRAQHVALWYKDDQLKTWLKNIMAFTLHVQPRVRKSGQYNVSAVLKGSEFMISSPLRKIKECTLKDPDSETDPLDDEMEEEEGDQDDEEQGCNGEPNDTPAAAASAVLEVHPAADLVSDFLLGQLQTSGSMSAAANKSLLHMLVFTRQIIAAMPKHKLQKILRRLFSLVSLGRGLMNTIIMQALYVLCESRPPVSVLPLTLTNNILNTLTKHSEGVSSAVIAAPHDPVAVRSWSAVVAAAVQHAIRLSPSMGIKWCSEYCRVALQYWRSDNLEVLKTMGQSLSSVLGSVYDTLTTLNCDEHESEVRVVIQQLEAGLSYQYQGAWPFVFELLGQCYSELGLYYAPMMIPSLKSLSELMASNNLSSVRELEKAIGMAVQGLGTEAVVCAAPIDITGDITKDEKNLWLLPLLHKFTKNSRLMFFKTHFIPLAEKCFNVLAELEKNAITNRPLIQTYNTVQYQIWRLLPSFANQAQDVEVAQSNKPFAKLICGLIEFSDDSRIDAMAALRHMITSENSPKILLAKNASNYLPALFNVYIKEPKTNRHNEKDDVIEGPHRMAAYKTIKAYLKITPQKLSEMFMKNILEKYKAEDIKKTHRKRSLLYLARCFVPYVSAPLIQDLYEEVTPLISNAKDKRKQKAAYKVLEEVLSADSEDCEEFVNENLEILTELLLSNVGKAAPSSRAPKLRCAKVVLGKVSSASECDLREEFLRSVVGECVMCIGRTNSRTARTAAFDVLADLPSAMKRIKNLDEDNTVRECMRLLSGGLLERPAFCANTIIAIIAYTHLSRETMPIDILQQNAENMCALLQCASREVVQACLSFVKGVISLYPSPLLGPLVKTIMNGIVNMTPDCARKYRVKTKSILTRLMRTFGDDHICKLVPAKNVTLLKRLRNMRKEASRTRRQREAEEQQQEAEEGGDDENFTDRVATSVEEIIAQIDQDLEGDDEDESSSSKKKQQRRCKNKTTTAWMEDDDSDDDVLDLLGSEAAKAIMTKKPRQKKERGTKEEKAQEENGGFAVDPSTGKLIIVDNEKEDRLERDADHIAVDDIEDMMNMKAEAVSGKISNKKRAREDDDDDDDSVDLPLAKRKNKKNFDYGAEFRSKKCRGDVVKKGQSTKPYAYAPFSKEMLNKRKQAKYDGQFKSLVKGAKAGVRHGTKQRKSGKNKGNHQ